MIRPSIQIPRHIAQAIRYAIAPTIFALTFFGVYLETLVEVTWPEGRTK